MTTFYTNFGVGLRACLRAMGRNGFLTGDDRSSALMVATYGSDEDVRDAYVTLRHRALDRATDLAAGTMVQVGEDVVGA